MKQEFEMTQQEMNDIIAINKNQSPVMKFGDSWSGMDLQEKINHYWETLGKQYGFKHLTVEGSSKGKLFFLAEPKPIEEPHDKIKTNIINTIDDLCSNFLYYDRKEDETLSVDVLNKAVKDGVITIDEMVSEFRKHLKNTFK